MLGFAVAQPNLHFLNRTVLHQQIPLEGEDNLEAVALTWRQVLAFKMAVTALSLPEMVILKKVLRLQLLAVFVGLITVGIISIGYIFNAIIN